jgi:hypothetical protein
MALPHTSAKAKEDDRLRLLQRGRACAPPKSHCPNRSEWRVVPGRPPERLSPYYQLICEFGSSLILSWRNEGSEPVYVCEEHAKGFEHSADVRASTGSRPSETSKNNETEDSAEAEPLADPKPISAAAPVIANISAEAQRETTRPVQSLAGRCAAINQVISDLATQLENAFSQSEATISVVDTIDSPLEQAALEVIGNQAIPETQKDVTVQQLGALQESLKQDVGQKITPLQAHRIKQTVGNCLSGDISVVDEAKPGYRAVYDSLESAIHTGVPKAKRLEERLANLLKMKAELGSFPEAKELAPA